MNEVVEYACCVLVIVKNFKNHFPFFWRDFLKTMHRHSDKHKVYVIKALKRVRHLCVSAVGDRLVLVVLQPDVSQLRVGDILHVQPLHLELT